MVTPMHAELVAIGAELLLGEISDTNSSHIARALREIGLEVVWMSVVGDHAERITHCVSQAVQRSPIVITTGGLGPTVDDPTRASIAQACQRELEFRPELWEQIQERFRRFKRVPTENNKRQAYVPQGAIVLENPVGTAPCFIVELDHSVVISLPGVPREMEHMLQHAVVPYLRRKFNLTGVIRAKTLRTVGVGESHIDDLIGELEKMENPVVGLAAHAGQVDIRITAKAASEAEAQALIAPIEAEVRAKLGSFIYGEGKEPLEMAVLQLFKERGLTLAIAEAGTHGALFSRLAVLPNVSEVLLGQLHVATEPPPNISALATEARNTYHSDWGLSVSATPAGSGYTIDVAIVNAHNTDTRSLGFGTAPALLGTWATTAALNVLRLGVLKGE